MSKGDESVGSQKDEKKQRMKFEGDLVFFKKQIKKEKKIKKERKEKKRNLQHLLVCISMRCLSTFFRMGIEELCRQVLVHHTLWLTLLLSHPFFVHMADVWFLDVIT